MRTSLIPTVLGVKQLIVVVGADAALMLQLRSQGLSQLWSLTLLLFQLWSWICLLHSWFQSHPLGPYTPQLQFQRWVLLVPRTPRSSLVDQASSSAAISEPTNDPVIHQPSDPEVHSVLEPEDSVLQQPPFLGSHLAIWGRSVGRTGGLVPPAFSSDFRGLNHYGPLSSSRSSFGYTRLHRGSSSHFSTLSPPYDPISSFRTSS